MHIRACLVNGFGFFMISMGIPAAIPVIGFVMLGFDIKASFG